MRDLLAIDTDNIKTYIYGFRIDPELVHIKKRSLAYFLLLSGSYCFKGDTSSRCSSVFNLNKDQYAAFIIRRNYIKLGLPDLIISRKYPEALSLQKLCRYLFFFAAYLPFILQLFPLRSSNSL